MPARLEEQEDENGHQGGTRECDEVTRRASPGQPRLPSQHAPVTAVTRARSTFALRRFSYEGTPSFPDIFRSQHGRLGGTFASSRTYPVLMAIF